MEHRRAELDWKLGQVPQVPAVQNPTQAGFHSGFAPARDSVRWAQVDLGAEYPLDSVFVIPTVLNEGVAYGFPARYRIETGRDAFLSEPELLVEGEPEDLGSILPIGVSCGGRVARYVRFTALGLVPQPRLGSRFIFCLGELLAFSGGRNVALNGNVLAPNSVSTLPTWAPFHLVDGIHGLGVPSKSGAAYSNGWHSGIFKTPESKSWVQVDFGREALLDEISLIPAHPPDYPDRVGFGFPRRFKIETALEQNFRNPETVYDSGEVEFSNPGDTRVSFRVPHRSARFVRVTAELLWERSGDFVFALGELEAFEGRENVARSKNVTASDSTLTKAWAPGFLVDGVGGLGELVEEEAWLSGLSEKRGLLREQEFLGRQLVDAERVRQKRLMGIIAIVAVGALVVVFLWDRRNETRRRRDLENLRREISRDLHDEIGSHLCSIRLMAEMAAATGEGGSAVGVIGEIKGLAEQGTESLRDMVWLVREGESPNIGRLVEKMRSVMSRLMGDMECLIELENVPVNEAAPLSFHRDILFIVREALHNVRKHSEARLAKVVFRWNERDVELVIEDFGKGFDPRRIIAGDGIGNMRFRSERLGGALCLESVENTGTRVTARVARP